MTGVLLAATALIGAWLGASLASFLGVVAERVPQGMPITGRSHCACGRQLRAWENVPVLGWLRCHGVASCCGAHIPVRYVQSEVVGGVVGGVAAAVIGVTALHKGPVGLVSSVAFAALVVSELAVVWWCWPRREPR